MAKRRKRKVKLGSAPATHRENLREVMASLQKAVRHAEDNAKRGASCDIRFDNIVLTERRLENATVERHAIGGKYKPSKENVGTTLSAFSSRIGFLTKNFQHDCVKKN